jgi:predicted dehydrogenase
MKQLNVGLIGCGFMGRAHSNAYRKVGNFFDLEYQPVLKAICDSNEDKAKAHAANGALNPSKPTGKTHRPRRHRSDRYLPAQ